MGSPCTRTQINQIEKVQRRAARYVTNRYHNTSSVTDMLHNLNWPSLEIRRTRVRLIMFYKIIHHVVAIHPLDTLLLPTTTITRYNSSHTYQHIRTDKDSYKYSFYPRTIIQWNILPIHVHEAGSFRVRSTNFLLNLRDPTPISMKFGTLGDYA